MTFTKSELEGFFSRINKTETCWIWTAGSYTQGYGTFWFRGKGERANRISYLIHKGEFPEGKPFACHTCDNPICVNPEHLFAGDSVDNAADMMLKGRGKFQPHFGEDNGFSKLTSQKVLEMLNDCKVAGTTQLSVAKKHGVSPQLLNMIVRGKIWSQVTGIKATRETVSGVRVPSEQRAIEV